MKKTDNESNDESDEDTDDESEYNEKKSQIIKQFKNLFLLGF